MIFQYLNKETGVTHDIAIDDAEAEIVKLYVQRREQKNDNLIIIGGDTGTGKSNHAAMLCAYYSHLTGIPYNLDSVYFDPDKMVNDAIRNEDKIYHFDEALFGGMASDWQSKKQKKLIKMFMLCRKKRHFFVMCMPDAMKLKDYLILERSVALVVTYLRDGLTAGRFLFFRKKSKEILYNTWKKSGFKQYSKYYSFRGTFSKALPKVMNEDEYDKKKDAAILSIDQEETEKEHKHTTKLYKLMKIVSQLHHTLKIKQSLVAEAFGVSIKTLNRWKTPNEMDESPKETKVLADSDGQTLFIINGRSKENNLEEESDLDDLPITNQADESGAERPEYA